jgi:hypothetical protein
MTPPLLSAVPPAGLLGSGSAALPGAVPPGISTLSEPAHAIMHSDNAINNTKTINLFIIL